MYFNGTVCKSQTECATVRKLIMMIGARLTYVTEKLQATWEDEPLLQCRFSSPETLVHTCRKSTYLPYGMVNPIFEDCAVSIFGEKNK